MLFVDEKLTRKGIGKTANFTDFYNSVKNDFDIREPLEFFFDKYVQIRFVKVKPPSASKTMREKIEKIVLLPPDKLQYEIIKRIEAALAFDSKISKIEGMALQQFKHDYGDFPKLNNTNETKGMEGF